MSGFKGYEYYDGLDLVAPVKPKKPRLGLNPTAQQARDYAEDLENYQKAEKVFRDERSKYYSLRQLRYDEFKEYLQKTGQVSPTVFKIVCQKLLIIRIAWKN